MGGRLGAAQSASAQWVLQTVAGGGAPEGSPATNTPMIPQAVALDGAGHLFIADYINSRVWQVDLTTGATTTAAGTGTAGFDGDGPATSRMLNTPGGVAADGSGHLFIADTGNHRIRQVDLATGVMTTIAGTGTPGFNGDGPATSQNLNNPFGVAVDGAGLLFIGDTLNYRIRQVDLGTGAMTTVAGTGTPGFNGDGPATSRHLRTASGVAVDGSGLLFIADTFNHRVRQVDLATGTMTTVAGTGTAGFDGDGTATLKRLSSPADVAVDGAEHLIISDSGTSRIRQVDLATGTMTTVAGTGTFGYNGDGPATARHLNEPIGVAANAAGQVFIADSDNFRVALVDLPTATMTTVAGTRSPTFDGDGPATERRLNLPFGVAADAAGHLFVSDMQHARVRQIDLTTGTMTTVAGTGIHGFDGDGTATARRLNFPRGVAADGTGLLFIADSGNAVIRQVDLSTGAMTIVAGNAAFGPGYNGDGPATARYLYNPSGVAVDGAGQLFIADTFNHLVRQVDLATGSMTTVAGTTTQGFNGDGPATLRQLNTPAGVAVDGAGHLFIADTGNQRIRQVDLATGTMTTVAGSGGFGLDDDGLALAHSLKNPSGVAVDGVGYLLIADTENSRVRQVDLASGIMRTVAGTGNFGFNGDGPATARDLYWPSGVAVDPTGQRFIADTYNDRIRKLLTVTGVIVTPNNGLTTSESGGQTTLTVVLSLPPVSDVTIAVTSTDLTEGDVTLSSLLTFTTADWNVAQTVTVTGVDDLVDDGDVAYAVQATVTAGDPAYLALAPVEVTLTNVDDDDTPGLTVTPTSGLLTSEAGATATFEVVLAGRPVTNIIIGVTSNDLTEGTVTSAPLLTFTPLNWNVAQTVIVTGADDFVDDGDVAYAVRTTVTAGDPGYVALAPIDYVYASQLADAADGDGDGCERLRGRR